jgi:hypothetical protein
MNHHLRLSSAQGGIVWDRPRSGDAGSLSVSDVHDEDCPEKWRRGDGARDGMGVVVVLEDREDLSEGAMSIKGGVVADEEALLVLAVLVAVANAAAAAVRDLEKLAFVGVSHASREYTLSLSPARDMGVSKGATGNGVNWECVSVMYSY